SDQAKPNGVIWVLPGQEAAFLAPLDVRKVPGVGKVTEKNLHAFGIRKVGDLARLDEAFLEQHFGKWGLALAGKSRGLDAGGWSEGEEQMDLLGVPGEDRHERWKQTLAAADRLRDRFGESAVGLASSLRGNFRERTHENPAGLPGKTKS